MSKDVPKSDETSVEGRALLDVQRATLNILEDFAAEKEALQQIQRGTLNILEDFNEERARSSMVQRASLNILDDFDAERQRLEDIQRASLNILEDFDSERGRLEEVQRALLNILEDFDLEKENVARINLKLEAANKELEAFSYSVSHDLRAPLRGIDGFSQALLEDCADQLDESGKRHLERIQAAARRMGQLIDDLLNLSRLSRAQMERVPVDLTALAIAVATNLHQLQPGRSLFLDIRRSAEGYGDPRLLRIVLENLIGNAWKFTSKTPHARIEFGSVLQDGQPVYFVRDNGAGFDMAYASKLFGAFQRLHAADEFPGTGIGLATVQRIVHRHGGRVWAEGVPGQGATFYFTLEARPYG